MKPSDLHVFTARSNPLRWQAPHDNWNQFADKILAQGVSLVVVECAYGEEPFRCDRADVSHIGVRARTRGWVKENLLNLGIQRTPSARYLAWIDADVIFRDPNWADKTLHALQNYDVVQPWSDALDLGPNDEIIAHHRSFCRQWFLGQPVVPRGPKWWKGDKGPYDYPHSGYAWAMTRQAYDWVGGLFEYGGMGSGDHHMALGLVGEAIESLAPGSSEAYNREVMRWQDRAMRHINKNIGFVGGTIEHLFHGSKQKRGYISRWDMFLKHGFDPHEDLKRNSYGVLEFALNKPELRHDFDRYLQERDEDANRPW